MFYNKRRVLEVADFNYAEIRRFKTEILDFDIPLEEIEFPEIFIEATLTDWDEEQGLILGDWSY